MTNDGLEAFGDRKMGQPNVKRKRVGRGGHNGIRQVLGDMERCEPRMHRAGGKDRNTRTSKAKIPVFSIKA